jgi:CDP-glucose 4,6-dehydratase
MVANGSPETTTTAHAATAPGLTVLPQGNPSRHRFWRGRSVLVTGAGGFLASWLCRALVDAGADVIGIVRDSTGERLLERHGVRQRMTVVHGSIVDYPLVERVLNEYEADAVFHVAAQAIVGAANRSPLSTFESNIKGTWNVLEACRVSRATARLVVASSDKAYGDQAVLPYREDTALHGRYPYDASKVCTDVLARCYATTYDLPIAVTRCANIFGGGDLNWSRLIPGTIRAVLAGEAPVIRSDGTPERDYLYIDDAVDAYLTLGARLGEPEVRGRAFNFGSGQPTSVLQLVGQILGAAGSSLEPRILGQAAGEIDRQFLDSSLARATLGWEPWVSLADGLRRTIAWYRTYLQEAVAGAEPASTIVPLAAVAGVAPSPAGIPAPAVPAAGG